jgi:uncharacterized protein YbjQ (UPF0145 family)
MGSSVVQHGWVRSGAYYWNTGEVPGLSEPWNLARDRAFDRLRQEAELAGADGVIGIEVTGGTLAGPGNVEIVVFGTAVRDTAFPAGLDRRVGMCTLSGQEVDKLRRIGAEVRAVVGHTSVIAVQLMPNSAWVMNAGGMFNGGAQMNIEIPEISQGVYLARRRVMSEVRRQASAVDANDIVVSMLQHTIEHREYEQAGYTNHYFYVTMNVLGTAIRLGVREPYPAPLPAPVMSINLGAS